MIIKCDFVSYNVTDGLELLDILQFLPDWFGKGTMYAKRNYFWL
jgi:hypothetical protein